MSENPLPEISSEVISRIAGQAAKTHGIIPVAVNGDVLVLVSRGSLGNNVMAELKLLLDTQKFELAAPDQYPEVRAHFDALLEKYYPRGPVSLMSRIADSGCGHDGR